MGVSRSGKTLIGSLLAEQLALPLVDSDDLRPRSNVAKMARGVPLDNDESGLVVGVGGIPGYIVTEIVGILTH